MTAASAKKGRDPARVQGGVRVVCAVPADDPGAARAQRSAGTEGIRTWLGWPVVLALAGLVAAPAPGPAAQREAPAQEGALFLLLPVGARGVGLGRAMTALPTEEGAFWNPAALAEQSRRRVMVYRGEQLVGASTAVSVLAPWKGVGTFGASYFLLDVGEQDLRDQFGNTLGSLSVRNHLAIASFATSFAGRVHAGVNMKLVQFRGACRGQCQDLETTSSAYAVDMGVQATPFARMPLRFGAMLAHAGTDFRIRNEEQADPLPMRLRFAAAYEVLHWIPNDPATELWFALEVEDRARDMGSPSYYLGLDFSAADMFFVSAGYVGGELDQTNGASVGVGFRLDRFDVHLAKSLTRSPVTGESEPVHVSFGVAF